jgi:hypothetical protein
LETTSTRREAVLRSNNWGCVVCRIERSVPQERFASDIEKAESASLRLVDWDLWQQSTFFPANISVSMRTILSCLDSPTSFSLDNLENAEHFAIPFFIGGGFDFLAFLFLILLRNFATEVGVAFAWFLFRLLFVLSTA